MSTSPELIRLLKKLASDIRRPSASAVRTTPDGDGDEAPRLISSLIKSLNSDDQIAPRVRVLDAALSLMGFKTPEVCGARIECLLGTIISVLSSSVSCRLLHSVRTNTGLLQVGSSISPRDCDELIRVSADVLASLKDHSGASPKAAGLSDALLYAVLKVVASSSSHQPHLQLSSTSHEENEKLSAARRTVISRLTTFLPEEIPGSGDGIPLRGLPSILDLQIATVSAVLDVLSRPMCWGVSMEMGLKYPFSHAYFPDKHHELLAILSGHISCESFLELVSHIGTVIAATTTSSPTHPSCDSFGLETSVDMVHNESFWAVVLQFPAWFYFATSLIFSGENDQHSNVIWDAAKAKATNAIKLQQAATRYISWVLSPTNEAHCHLLVDHLQEISRSWITKNRTNYSYEQKFYSDIHNKSTLRRSRKLKIPKVSDCDKLHLAADDVDCSTVGVWLKEFDAICARFCRTVISDMVVETEAKQNVPYLLFRKIPLGILIWSPGNLNEKECELLLHYAATGEIRQLKDTQKKNDGCFDCNDPTLLSGDRQWALSGACLVFSLFDIIEDMSILLFDNKDTQLGYFLQLKVKASRYLLRCVKTLLTFQIQQFQNDAGGKNTMADLSCRLSKWMQQGGKMFEGYGAFDDVVDELAKRFTVSNIYSKGS